MNIFEKYNLSSSIDENIEMIKEIFKISICLYASSIGIVKLFNLKNSKKVPSILCIITIILSLILFRSTMEMIRLIDIYRLLVIPFQFIIPILTLILATIIKRRRSDT